MFEERLGHTQDPSISQYHSDSKTKVHSTTINTQTHHHQNPLLPRLRPRHLHNSLNLLPLRIFLLIPPRIPRIHPSLRPPPPKLAHSPQQPHARAAQNPRRRNHKRRTTDNRPNSRASNSSSQSARGGVLGVAEQAPEDEDGDVARAAEQRAGAQTVWLGAVGWVVEVFYRVGGFLQFGFRGLVVVW
jgi:hypothetical protein